MIKDLVLAGMNIARLNFSHDSHREHEERINMIREAVKELKNETKLSYPVAIALDTKGPEIRTGTLEKVGQSRYFSLPHIIDSFCSFWSIGN